MNHRGKSEYNYGPRGGQYKNSRWTEEVLGEVVTIKCPECGEEDPHHLGETYKGNYGRVHYRCEHCQYIWSEKAV